MKVFRYTADLMLHAEDLDHAFMQLACHFAGLAAGVEVETVAMGNQELKPVDGEQTVDDA